MRETRLLAVGAWLFTAVSMAPAIAQPTAAPSGGATARSADEKAVRDAAQAFARAFEKGDARAVGALFTDEAEYLNDDGDSVQGREALGKAYTDFFTGRKDVKATAKTDSVRFLAKDTAIEEGTFTVEAKGTPANSSRYSALYVRQNGRWLIAMLKEWSDDSADVPALKDLSWLLGTWEGDGTELRARTTYEWAENKNFIKSRYTITQKKDNKVVSTGTQVIGVDPVRGSIRAWTFDGDGGFGEAFWNWDGNRWMIDSSGTQADGSETTAVNFLSRAGDDAFTWRSVQRTVDGESQPDLPMVRVKRVQAASASSSK